MQQLASAQMMNVRFLFFQKVRCLFRHPLFCSAGQELTGTVHMEANERQEIIMKALKVHKP